MVNIKKFTYVIYALAVLTAKANFTYAADNKLITQDINGDACDDRQLSDDKQTAENRAVDKASLAAVKLSGVIQKYHPELGPSALDVVSYRIIDEHLLNSTHEVTLSDDTRVCVKLKATLELLPQDLDNLIKEYKNSEPSTEQIEEVAENVKENTSFKANTLEDKKLVYIENMKMWNGDETNHYTEFLSGLFSNSDFYYITGQADAADYTLTPVLVRSEVDKIDKSHHKMQMQIELNIAAVHDVDFEPLTEMQNHFILFASDKDEQEIADTLIRKLFTKGSQNLSKKIDNAISKRLEERNRSQ